MVARGDPYPYLFIELAWRFGNWKRFYTHDKYFNGFRNHVMAVI